jgi:hypothetical protein
MGNLRGRRKSRNEINAYQYKYKRKSRILIFKVKKKNKIRKYYLFIKLFILLQKKEINPIESRENETLFSNVVNEMINDVLNDAEMDQLLDNF